jgi:hypothetical protein
MRSRPWACVALVLLAIALEGCGGGSGTTASAPPGAQQTTSTARTATPSSSSPGGAAAAKQQFIASADAICGRVVTLLKHSKLASSTLAEIARITPIHVLVEQEGLSDLSKLAPPATIAGRWRQILTYMRTLAHELDTLGKTAKARDKAAIHALAASKKRVHAKLRAAAAREGFKDCQAV